MEEISKTAFIPLKDAPYTRDEPPKTTTGQAVTLAKKALNDLLAHWWVGSAETGHIIPTKMGTEIPEIDKLWEIAHTVFALDSAYMMTGDDSLHQRIAAEWNAIRTGSRFPTFKSLTEVGTEFRPWQDDAGWDAMLYMTFYRHTGDELALAAAGQVVRNAYAFWKDGSTGSGLFYIEDLSDRKQRHKSLHAVSLMTAATEFLWYQADEQLENDTMALYEWAEEHLGRHGAYTYRLVNGEEHQGFCDDGLYWFNYNQERENAYQQAVYTGPESGECPHMMEEAGSAVFIGGAMGMNVLHARLYRKTGEPRYLERAQKTARALLQNEDLIRNGVWTDAGDGFTNAAFVRQWVTEVLSLPGMPEDRTVLYRTAASIMEKARTADGHYSACWSGPAEEDADTPWGKMGWTHEKMMVNATSIHTVIAAGLDESREEAK